MIDHASTVFCFGEFEVDADRRLLLRNGEKVPLKAKTFELLLALIENRNDVLSKNDLLDKVWENQFVEENNLTVHVAALRKALGETKNEHRFIVTVPGTGYKFVGDVAPPRNGGNVFVESRKIQKIVVSEEFEEQLEPDAETTIPVALANAPVTRSWKIGAIAAIVLAATLATAGLYTFRSGFADGFLGGSIPFSDHRVIQLTTNGKVGSAALSSDGKAFAYVIDDVGMKSLWLGYVDGGNHLLLKPAAEATYNALAFSPDGSQLYFSISDPDNRSDALYRIPVMGGVSTRLLTGVGNFALSPDGKSVAFGRRAQDSYAVAISSLDGVESRDVASFPKNEPFLFGSISWSSDSSHLAVTAVRPGRIYRHDVVVIDIGSGVQSRIPLEKYREITKTAWLPNGDGLVVTAIEESSHSSVPQYRLVHVSYPGGVANEITADRSNYGESWHNDSGATLSVDGAGDSILAVEHRQLSNVWTAPADDLAAATQITFSSFGRYDGLWGLDWTPDGRIIYTTSDTRNQYLAQMQADGSAQKPLTDPSTDPGHVDSVLTVSADGRYILFHSNRVNGEFDIWRANADGSNPKQLTFGGKAFIPAPSPDGHWVYYKSWLDDRGGLCRVPIDGGEPECFTDKETTWVSFSPDGEYFAASYITDKQRLAIFSAKTHEVVRQFDMPKTGTLYMGSRWTADGEAVTYRDNTFGYWIQPIAGGEAKRLEGLPRERLYNFSWSRDGKSLAFIRGQEIRDVVLFRRGE
jgi:DNA-binding winged helix-turn-helix (wHTH) protein/Tol biopolymer transport system component